MRGFPLGPCPCLLIALAIAAAPARAQHGLATDPERRPLAGVKVQLLPRPKFDLVLLHGHRPAEPAVATTTDDRGVFRFAAQRSGGLLLEHDGRLGAVVPLVMPEEAVRVTLQPLGEVTFGSNGAPFTLQARWIGDGGELLLRPMTGNPIRLPAGRYEAFVRRGEDLLWVPLDLGAGQTVALQLPESQPQPVALPREVELYPTGWPDFLVRGGEPLRLWGAAKLAAWTLLDEGGDLWVDLGVTALQKWQRPERERDPRVNPARVFGGSWQFALTGDHTELIARPLRPGITGRRPPEGSTVRYLCEFTDGPQESAGPLSDDSILPGWRWRPLRCVIGNGEVASHVALEVRQKDRLLTRMRLLTDAGGRVEVPCCGDGDVLRVVDPRFVTQEFELTPTTTQIPLDRGQQLRGRVELPDRSPVPRALVTLRDPSGRMQPNERTATTDLRGHFEFAGLPDDRPLVLFAQQRRDGRMWSGTFAGAKADGGSFVVEIRNEDPVLPGGR